MAYDIGGMLARSGATTGQLMGGGIADVGAGIGGLLTRRREKQAEQNAQQQFQQILNATSNRPSEMLREAQLMMARGDPNLQRVGKMLMDEATRLAGVQTAAEEKKVTAATGRGEGELMALANDPKFNLNDQKMRSGLLGMADAFGVSRARAMEIALEARENRKGADGDFRTTDQVTIRDEKGNEFIQYSIQNINNPTDTPIIKTVPVGSAPNEPIGKTQIISSTTGASAFDKPKIRGDVVTEQEFAELKVDATAQIPELMSQSRILDDAVVALDTMESQGLPEVVVNTIRKEFGVQDPDIAEYEMLVGELMFSRLKPLFGGVISEGEREAIMGLYNDMKRGNPANKRILMQLQKKVKETIVKANLIRRADSFDDYNMALDRMYPTEEEKTEQNVVDFGDLPTQG